MKDNEIANLVNKLKVVAVDHHDKQCLRELISKVVNKSLVESRASNWISVDDELPQLKVRVLVWVKYATSEWHMKTGFLSKKAGSDECYFVITSPHTVDGRIVSHWQLQEAPNG